MASGETEEKVTIVDTQATTTKMSASSNVDEASTKATEENDSDSTIESKGSESKKDDNSDAETDVDDPVSSNDDSTTQEEKNKEAKEKEEAEKRRIEELKIKYKDWPLKDVTDPHENDVMYGRGGGTNHHPGNKRYRKMVEERKEKYVSSKRLDKPLVALEIIREWRAQLPPGRFLKHNESTGKWDDVGDKKAREKTSQALREKAQTILQKLNKESTEDNGNDTGDKKIGFAEGTKDDKKGKSKLSKGVLKRDTSVGPFYISSDEKVDIGKFSWQEGIKGSGKVTSMGSGEGVPSFAAKEPSAGSIGSFSRDPLIPDFHGNLPHEEPRREYSNGSTGGWSQFPHYPHTQPPGMWTQPHPQAPPPPPPPPHYGSHHQRSGGWNNGREHSFSLNPLPHANINRSAPIGAFESRTGSGSWNGPYAYPNGPLERDRYPPPPHHMPPPVAYGGPAYQSSSTMGTIGSTGSPEQTQPGPYPPHAPSTSRPPFDINIANAAEWSRGGSSTSGGSFGRSQYYRDPQPVPGADTSPPRGIEAHHPHRSVPRPPMIKRDTSNQNESYETKPSIKRPVLGDREKSATSKLLKQQYIPEALDPSIQLLHEQTERQLRLSHSPIPDETPITRESTRVDSLEAAVSRKPVPKPSPLNQGDRKNTMDALGFDDLLQDTVSQTIESNDMNSLDSKPLPALKRPSKLTQNDRLSTNDILNIMDHPIVADDTTDDDIPLPF